MKPNCVLDSVCNLCRQVVVDLVVLAVTGGVIMASAPVSQLSVAHYPIVILTYCLCRISFRLFSIFLSFVL